MYRIIVVDDERQIREGIIKKIDWNSHGFELVGTGENGVDALELVDLLKPDVILTDIKMPYMDGLELGSRVFEKYPSIRIVIFSGFDEFQYAQRAIQINAQDYILKPFDSDELIQVLSKLKRELDEETANKLDIEKQRLSYQQNLSILIEQFLSRLMSNHVSVQIINEKIQEYKLLNDRWWLVSLVRIEYEKENLSSEIAGQPELLPLIIKNLISKHLDDSYHHYSFFYHDYIAVLCCYSEAGMHTNLMTALDSICEDAKRHLGATLTVGIGTPTYGLFSLYKPREEAEQALGFSVFSGRGRSIYIGDFEPKTAGEQKVFLLPPDELLATLKTGTKPQITAALNGYLGQLEQLDSLENYQLAIIELAVGILKIINSYQIPHDVFKESGINYDSLISGTTTIDELKANLDKLFFGINQSLMEQLENSSQRIIEQAKEMIDARYADHEFSLDALSKELHFSPNYFSALFKRGMNTTFSDYLRDVRLEKAVELLVNTELLAKKIASMVGYNDLAYFSYVFKKKFGTSPTKYRNSRWGKE